VKIYLNFLNSSKISKNPSELKKKSRGEGIKFSFNKKFNKLVKIK